MMYFVKYCNLKKTHIINRLLLQLLKVKQEVRGRGHQFLSYHRSHKLPGACLPLYTAGGGGIAPSTKLCVVTFDDFTKLNDFTYNWKILRLTRYSEEERCKVKTSA